MQTHKSICRVCSVSCAIELDVEDGRVVAMRGDVSDPLHGGYTCIRGQQIIEQHEHPDRLRASMAKRADGGFQPIPSEQAYDEIATRLAEVIARHGPRSVAVYNGTQGTMATGLGALLQAWMAALGSPNYFTSLTVDQVAKYWAAPARHGVWTAGVHHVDTADVLMVVGANPLISHWSPRGGPITYNPTRWVRDAKKRGMKLVVIDPRRTEFARYADLHLRVKPGEDPTLLAGIMRVIFEEGLYDRDFCDRFTRGFDELRAAVADFTPDYVERRTGVPAADMVEAARLFGRGPRGGVSSGTGPDMAPRGNLSEHLLVSLNTLCGRYRRGGEEIWDLEVLTRSGRDVARILPPWHDAPSPATARVRNLRGVTTPLPNGGTATEMPSAALADEILTPGEGQIRALLVFGGNPATAFPNQPKVRRALESLDLLVCVDIKLSATAKLADYVLAPRLSFERADLSHLVDSRAPASYAQYAEALVEPDFDVIEEHAFVHGLARRMGTKVTLAGGDLPLDCAVDKHEFMKLIYPNPRIPLDELRANPGGRFYPELRTTIIEQTSDAEARLDFAPAGIVEELAEVHDEPLGVGAGYGAEAARFSHRLICRRVAHAFNSSSRDTARSRMKGTTNPALMNPTDLEALGLASDDLVEIRSDYGMIPAVVQAAADVLPGTISMTHSFGDLPEYDHLLKEIGVAVTRLVDDETNVDSFYGMPRFTGIPVNVAARPA